MAETPATTTLLTEPATTPEGAPTAAPDATAPATDAGAPATPEAPAPLEYAFVAPEGVELDATLVEAVTPLFAEAQLAPEAAQKLVSAYAAHVAAQDMARAEAHQAEVQGWADAVRTDPVLGGANLTATLHAAQRAVHRFGDDDLRALFNERGIGNHPAVVRAFAKIGQQTAEDTVIRGASGGAPEPTRTPGSRIFTSMQSKE